MSENAQFRVCKTSSSNLCVEYSTIKHRWKIFRTGNYWTAFCDGNLAASLEMHADQIEPVLGRIAAFENLPFPEACCPLAKKTNCVCRLSFVCPDHYPGGKCFGTHD